jgi:hypothetical protein
MPSRNATGAECAAMIRELFAPKRPLSLFHENAVQNRVVRKILGRFRLTYFGANEATIFSNLGSPRSGSQ